MSVRSGQAGSDQETGSVLHQGMSHEAELRLLALTLAVEPRIRIVVEAWVALERTSPRKFTSALRPPSDGGSSEPSLGLKLFIEAQASIRVPSTEKCSVDNRRFTLG
jgi:hypothetical protein